MGNKCCPSFSSTDEHTPVENTPAVGIENTPAVVENIPDVAIENTPDAGVPSQVEVVEDENTLNICNLSEAVKDISNIDKLISFIQKRLEPRTTQQDPSTSQNAGTSQEPVVASPEMKSCFEFGGNLLQNALKRVGKDTTESSFRVKIGEKMRKLLIDILKESVKIHWLGVGLSVMGYVLESIDQVSTNKEKCVKLLHYMLGLAKQVKELNEELQENREKLKDVVDFIVQGCLMCVSQMSSHKLFRLISASVDAEEIKEFESQLGLQYEDLTMDAVIGLLKRTNFYAPTQGRKPDAVGIKKAQETVTGFLQLEVKDRRAVVIYGFGGVGKTTLASAVFSQLKLKDNKYKFCRLLMDELCSKEHIKALQSQLLKDLFGQTEELRDHVEGHEKLTEAFEKTSTQSMFVFIDNALKKDDLAKLLPKDLSCLPEQTKILVTTRKLDESSMFLQEGIQRHEYRVECLGSEESKQILRKRALASAHATFPPGVDIEGLVEICGGIPLVLEIVGARLSEHVNDVTVCNEMIDSLRESLIKGEGDEEKEIIEKVVDVVYNSLNEKSKEAFLDIACFFHNWERSFVSSVVGELQLKTLINAALVKLSHDPSTPSSPWRRQWGLHSIPVIDLVKDRHVREGFIEVHDIVRARGRKLSQRGQQRESDKRIMDEESWAEAVQDTQKLNKIEGICIPEPTSEFQIDAEHLDLMHASLRIVWIGYGIEIKGKCRKDFKNLRCLYQTSGTCFCVDLAKLKHLRVFWAELSNNPTELPSKLQYLGLGAVSGLRLSLNGSFDKLSSLKELCLWNDVVLPPNFGHLKSLRLLRFTNCKMVTLPQGFDSLSDLEGLSITQCNELESLPASFGELQKLTFLEVSACPKLWSLPENFGELTSLRILRVDWCNGLSTLPESFGNLSSLERLDLPNCSNLVSLPESFGNLSCLKDLFLGSHKLARLPESFDNLSCLKDLFLGSYKSARLPESFGNLSCLKELTLHSCEELSTLPESFGNLSSLEQLSLRWCSNLVSLPESFGNLSCLKELTLHTCEKLARLPNNFGHLKSLQHLCILDCRRLDRLSSDFGCLTSLETLYAVKSSDLKGEAMDVLVEMQSLKVLKIGGSPMLIKRWEDKGKPLLPSGNPVVIEW